MAALDFLDDELRDLEQKGLLRADNGRGAELVDACSNDYLGLGRRAVSRATLLTCEGIRTGAGASRLIHGTTPEHLALEAEVADWVQLPRALLFTSGYAAGVGLLSALVGRDDLVVSDSLNHASLIDGCRLARAQVRVTPHRDTDAVDRELRAAQTKRRWVVTESYFSMDGDCPDLVRLRRVCDETGAGLIVDEAHALGVFGPEGGGLSLANRVRPDALLGTLGKAVGVQGAFVAGSERLRQWLWNRARSFVFSTASTPIVARLALENVGVARRANVARARVIDLADRLRSRLRAHGIQVGNDSVGPVVPVLIGDNARAVQIAAELRERGILVQAIRPPTVPLGTARLRVTVSAALGDSDFERLANSLCETCGSS